MEEECSSEKEQEKEDITECEKDKDFQNKDEEGRPLRKIRRIGIDLGGVILPPHHKGPEWHQKGTRVVGAEEALSEVIRIFGADSVYIITNAYYQHKVETCICETLQLPDRTGFKKSIPQRPTSKRKGNNPFYRRQ